MYRSDFHCVTVSVGHSVCVEVCVFVCVSPFVCVRMRMFYSMCVGE
jgi:hypothetical protein